MSSAGHQRPCPSVELLTHPPSSPKIVSEFDALTQVAWLSTGFFITLCAFTLLYSQFLVCPHSEAPRLSSITDVVTLRPSFLLNTFSSRRSSSSPWAQPYAELRPTWMCSSSVRLFLPFRHRTCACSHADPPRLTPPGRFVAGIGAAGIFSSCFMVTIEITTLQERSTYIGLFGACFGLASVSARHS